MSSPLDSSESTSPIVNYLAMDPSSSPTFTSNPIISSSTTAAIPTTITTSAASNNNSGNNLQIVALSKDKYEKLVKEFQKYKQKYSKWKKVVNTEEQKWKQISLELEKKENELKTKIEENDILQFNNQRLEKRMAQLMFDLEEQLNKAKSTRQSSFFSGLFGSAETQPKKETTEVEIIKEELESKIKENESIHIHLFELKQEHEKTLAKFKHTISDLQHSIYGKDSSIHSLKTNIEENQKKFQNEKDHLKDKMRNLKMDMKSLKDSESFIRNYTYQQHEEISNLESYVNRKVLFDETSHTEFNLLNVSNFKRNPIEAELLEQLITILGNLSKCTSSTYLFIPQKIQHLNKLSNIQTNIIKLLNTRMNTTIDISTFPNLFSKLIKYCDIYLKYLKNDEITVGFDLTKEEEERAQTIDKKIIFCIFKTCKEIIHYKCKSLLYLTICSQLEDCQLENEEDFTQFEGFIYMRNTNATMALKYLNILFARFETFINTFYLNILDVDDYQVLDEYLNNNQIKRVFNSLNISAGSPPNDSLNAQQFISKLKNSKGNTSCSSGTFSIREECKYILQSIKDGFKDYCDILSNLMLKENVKNFVPPFIKNINDKLIKSLSQMLGLMDNLLLVHTGLQKCEKDFTNNYSRGALVDYETILSSKVKSTNVMNTQINNSITGNNNSINNNVFNFYYNSQESINHLRNESSNFLKMNQLNTSSSDFTMKDAEVMKNKMNELHSLIENLKKEKDEQSIIINNLKKQNEEYKNNLKIVRDRLVTDLNQNIDMVSKLNLNIGNPGTSDAVESYRNYTNQSIKELIRKVNELTEKLSKQVERTSNVDNNSPIVQSASSRSEPTSTNESSTPSSPYTKSSAITIRKPANDKEVFSYAEISREKELEAKYTKQIEYLMRQIEVCDLKTVQYRIQYQQAIMDLEKAQDQEEKLKLRISQIQQQMDNVSEELQSSKVVYEHQIQLLSDKLVEISTNYDINSSRLNDNSNSTTVVSGIGAAVSSFFGSAESTPSSSNERRKKNKQ